MKSDRLLAGAMMCLLSVLTWGGMFPVMESALKVMDPFYFTAIRYVVASIIFLGLLGVFEGARSFSFGGRTKSLWLLGSAGFAGFGFLVFLGQQIISGGSGAVVASTIMATMPLMAAVVTWISTAAKPSGFTLGSIFVALLGVLLVITKGDITVLTSAGVSLIADLLIFAGAFSWVVYTMGATRFAGWSPLRYTTLTCVLGVGTIFVLVFLATLLGLLSVPTLGTVLSVKWEFSYMIIFAGVMAVFTWNAGNKIISPINGVLFMNLVPVTALAITVLRGQVVTSIEVLGAAITISGLLANNLYQRRRARVSARERTSIVEQNASAAPRPR